MKKNSKKYKKQKVTLYFDENISLAEVEKLTQSKWKNNFKFITAQSLGEKGSDDKKHFSYCYKNEYILITRDKDFSDKNRFPINKSPCIVRLMNGKENLSYTLENFLRFTDGLTMPKIFFQESKLKISRFEFNIEKKHSKTSKVVKLKMTLKPGQNLEEIYNKIEKTYDYPASADMYELM